MLEKNSVYHRRNLRGYGGMRTPTFWSGGYRIPPLFGRVTEKNNSDFPSSSSHVSPYNIQEKVWRLGLCPRKWGFAPETEYIGEYKEVHRRVDGPGGLAPPQKGVENRFSCAKGTNIYVKILCLVIVNVNK